LRRDPRLGTRVERRGRAVAVRADHYLQETGHGPRALDCAEERAALPRRRHCDPERAGGSSVPRDPPPRQRAGSRMTPPRMLVVDDEPNIGASRRLILEGEGYSVTVCESAGAFRSRTEARRADAFLIDVRLPDGSGIDLLRLVRQNDPRTPVVMVSGHGTIAD